MVIHSGHACTLEIESDGDVLLTPYVPNGITGYDDDDDACTSWLLLVVNMSCVPPNSARCFTCINQIPLHTSIFDLLSSTHACYMMLLHVRHAVTLSFQLPFLVKEAVTQHVTHSDQCPHLWYK